jgi:hypothetical protein
LVAVVVMTVIFAVALVFSSVVVLVWLLPQEVMGSCRVIRSVWAGVF